jgi:hypothetical protein
MRSHSPEERLIQFSAGTVSLRAEGAIEMQRLCERVDWARLERMLAARRLLALLGSRIAQFAGECAPSAFCEAVVRAREDIRRHGRFLQLVTGRLSEALGDAGIDSLVLKGPILGELLYADAGYRSGSDIDLLVAAEDLGASVEVAVGLGYARPEDPLCSEGLPLLHFTLAHREGLLPNLELHWRVHWYEREFSREMLTRSIDTHELGRIPTARDGFVSLLLYYARDGLIDVRLLSDVVAWWERFGAELGAGSLDEIAERHPRLQRALSGALIAAEWVAGLDARQTLSAASSLDARVLLAARLANPNPRQSLTQLHADVALVDCLLTPRGGHRAFLRRQLLISRELLEYRAMRAHRERVGSSLGHGGRVLARNLLALPRAIRGPGCNLCW